MTYELGFAGNDVIPLFAPLGTFSKDNVAGAQKLAAMADQLIVWSGS